MYKLKYKKSFSKNIKKFINFYKNYFLNTFTDTGLFYEDLIRENYIKTTNKFNEEIIYNIEKILIEEKIYGYKILDNGNYEITISIGNYRFFIEYFEKNNIRYLENIKILRK